MTRIVSQLTSLTCGSDLRKSSARFDPDAALRDMLHSDDLFSVCAGTALGSCDATRLRVTRGGLTPQEMSSLDVQCEKMTRNWLLTSINGLAGSPTLGSNPQGIKADKARFPPTAASCWSPYVEKEGKVLGWLLLRQETGFDAPPRGCRQVVQPHAKAAALLPVSRYRRRCWLRFPPGSEPRKRI